MRILLSVSCLILAFVTAALASPVGAPLPMDRAFQLSAHRDRGDVVLNWQIEDGYYLYREYLTVTANGPSPQVETPSGVIKDDPGFGSTEVYYGKATATIVEPPAGTLKVTYQGCQDGGLCYPPTTVELDPSALPVSASTSEPERELATSAPQTKAVFQSVPDVPSSPPTGAGIRVADAPSGGMVGALLDRGGIFLLLAGFLGFGVLLAFTPCVFPMYPILAATLAREGERLSAGRGFALSSSYVLALAAAFSLLGVAAAWSGQNFQAALQSTSATILLAALFVALALSSFGLFELQLPASIRSAFGQRRTGRSSLLSSAALGFSSALVIGPCVTAPLAGALLYIAQTGNVALGAASLFALGIGKGVPLILMGTFGPGLLPRAGRWMERIRQVFGFIFLGTSLWFVDRLLSPGIGLALWSALLITFAVFIGTFDQLAPDAGSGPRLAKAAGILAGFYGLLLAVGAASGSTDPLNPLAAFATRPAEALSKPNEISKASFQAVSSSTELSSLLTQTADARARPALVYFTAEWCVTCTAIERSVLPAPAVANALRDVRLVSVDLTDLTDEKRSLMNELQVVGPPTMLFLSKDLREMPSTRLVGEISSEAVVASAGAISERAP